MCNSSGEENKNNKSTILVSFTKKVEQIKNILAQGKKLAKSQVHKYIKIKPQREDTASFSFDEKEKIEFQYQGVLVKLDLQKSVSQFDSLVKAHIVERIGLM